MTPEETKAMADRIAANRQEEAKTKVKEAKAAKVPAKPAKVAKVAKPAKVAGAKSPKAKKVIGPATKNFKFKDGPKDRKVCDVKGCTKKPKTGFRCDAHRKEIRKAQLAANNVVWKKRVKAGTAGNHVIYTRPGEKKPIATQFSLKNPDKAAKQVFNEHSILETVKDFKEILSRTKQERAKE